MPDEKDFLYMRRALQLAAIAEGDTLPNPMVGAVLVADDRIIGEGWHRRAGMPHAEVCAFESVPPHQKHRIPEATLYVTLEPCAHYGKTPPCAQRIIEEKVKRVCIACPDPFPAVNGRGIALLQKANIQVEVGVMQHEAEVLNAPFFTVVQNHRPYITLKWAESADRYIDTLRSPSEEPYHFSTPLRTREVHRLRHLHQAILVGRGTILRDNPSLTNRYWWGKSPLRIILDSTLSLLDETTSSSQNEAYAPSFRLTPRSSHCADIDRGTLAYQIAKERAFLMDEADYAEISRDVPPFLQRRTREEERAYAPCDECERKKKKEKETERDIQKERQNETQLPDCRTLKIFHSPQAALLLVSDPQKSVPHIPSWLRGSPDAPPISLLALPRGGEWLPELLKKLWQEGVGSLLVEGGRTTLQSFLDCGLYDAIECEVSPITLGCGIPAPNFP